MRGRRKPPPRSGLAAAPHADNSSLRGSSSLPSRSTSSLFYAYPLYRNLDLSFRDYTLRSFISGDAEFVGLDNYRDVLTDPDVRHGAVEHRRLHGVSLLFQYAIGLALAVFFFRKFPLATTLRALFLVPWLLPLLVSASVWAWMLNSDSGVVNAGPRSIGLDPIYWLTSPDWSLTAVLITNIWIGIPFNLVVLYSGLQAIPDELYEAAALDGASELAHVLAHHVPLAASRVARSPCCSGSSTRSRSSTSSGS